LCFAGREKSEAENFSLAEQASASRPEKSIKELPKKHTGTAEIKCSREARLETQSPSFPCPVVLASHN
jgi:hypothetical protein